MAVHPQANDSIFGLADLVSESIRDTASDLSGPAAGQGVEQMPPEQQAQDGPDQAPGAELSDDLREAAAAARQQEAEQARQLAQEQDHEEELER